MEVIGAAVGVGTLLVATAAGLVRKARSGRIRRGRARGGWALADLVPTGTDRVLLLQLSSPICTPCRRTAELLAELRARRPGVVHHEVDVAERPDLARALDVLRTPTVVAFDRSGRELLRVSGIPRPGDLESVLAPELA